MRLAALMCLAVSLAAQNPRLPSVTLPPELDRVLRDYERAWAGSDPAGLAALFTEDGFVPTSSGWRRGRPAIQDAYANAGGDLRLRAHEFSVTGDTGFIIGAYGYGETAATADRGKFILALRRVDGRWLIAADLDNANRG
jgi:uncharacterized protein (TIGR02246 family)